MLFDKTSCGGMRKDMGKSGKKLKNIKYSNYKVVIDSLRHHENQAIKEIVTDVGLSNTAISKIISNLTEKGIIKSIGKGTSTDEGGKRPMLFSINPDFCFCLVVLIRLDGIYGCVFDLSMKQRYMAVEKVPLESYEGCVSSTAGLIRQTLKDSGISTGQLCGIMIGFPGLVSFEKGTVVYPICSPQWGTDLHICEDIQEQLPLDIPVFVENSGRLAGYSELLNWTEARTETVVCIGHDSREELSGAGGCVIVQGKLMQSKGNVGEFGHMTVDANDKEQCRCGRYGCFESTTSVQRMLSKGREEMALHPESRLNDRGNEKLHPWHIFSAANDGDSFARELLEPVIKNFVIVINNIILAYDPDRISIFGAYSQAGSYFISEIRERVFQYFKNPETKIEYNQMDYQEMEKLGAALLVFNDYLAQDEIYS